MRHLANNESKIYKHWVTDDTFLYSLSFIAVFDQRKIMLNLNSSADKYTQASNVQTQNIVNGWNYQLLREPRALCLHSFVLLNFEQVLNLE